MLMECDGDSSLGPNGFNFAFLKTFCPLMQADAMDMLVEFYCNFKVPKALMSYFVALVSKVACPPGMNDFRPISLLDYLYKIVPKVLASRHPRVLPLIILDCQSAFILRKKIFDIFLVANEFIDYAQKIKRKVFVLKIDYEKTYDSVE